jgi:hypothetical protein
MPFWKAPRLNGEKLKDIARLIFMSSTRWKWNVKKALHENGWVLKIKMEELTIAHIEQFVKLWTQFQTIQLIEDIEDHIGLYSPVKWSIFVGFHTQSSILWCNFHQHEQNGLEDLATS